MWQGLTNEFTFGRIIIQEDHGIEPYVEFLGNLADTGCLVIPVDAQGAEVFTLEYHVRIVLPCLIHIGLIVLAAHGQDDAIALQLE